MAELSPSHEPSVFELSSAGRSGASVPRSDVAEQPLDAMIPAHLGRKTAPALPEVSEPQVVRHYTRLSQLNFSIDTGMYPLGSCTMKHNPKVADKLVSLDDFAELHPYQPDEQVQGALALLHDLENILAEIGGFRRVTLQPAAGAQGELCGLMMFRAYLEDQGQLRHKILVPDSAHGTNPASCALNGFEAVPLKTSDNGLLSIETVRAAIDDDLAGIMMTNPNTLGLFEGEIAEITELVRNAGGLVYMDGANLNAIVGKFRPGDVGVDAMHYNLHKTFGTPHGGGGPGAGPVGVSSRLVPFLPTPTIERTGESFRLDHHRPQSIGRLRTGLGNFGVLLRAYVYLREYGAKGLTRATEMAVLNANYLRSRLREFLHVPYPDRCMHEVIASDRDLKNTGITTMDIAKRLMDYGFHPPTVYFPLVVAGAMMIEPTETEPLETLDRLVDALSSIVNEAQTEPERVKNAPHTTPLRRLDEALAARKPVLRHPR